MMATLVINVKSNSRTAMMKMSLAAKSENAKKTVYVSAPKDTRELNARKKLSIAQMSKVLALDTALAEKMAHVLVMTVSTGRIVRNRRLTVIIWMPNIVVDQMRDPAKRMVNASAIKALVVVNAKTRNSTVPLQLMTLVERMMIYSAESVTYNKAVANA